MGLRKGHFDLQFVDPLNIHAIELKKIAEFDMIDDAQAIELVNARDGLRVLDLGKPRVGDVELLIPLGIYNFLAEIGDVARSHAEPKAEFF